MNAGPINGEVFSVAARKGGFFFKDPLPSGAMIYIVAVIIVGLPLFAVCLYQSLTKLDHRWLYLAALTFAASSFPVKIPLLRMNTQSLSITAGDVFVFAAMLFLGPTAAVTLAVIDGLVSSLRVKVNQLYKQLFNLAQLAVVCFVVAEVLAQLARHTAPQAVQTAGLAGLLAEVTLCGFLYFLLNSSMVAFAIALATGQHFVALWTRNFLWAFPANLVSALTAAVVFLFFPRLTFSAVIALIPLLLVAYYFRRIRAFRIQQDQPVLMKR